MKTMKAKRTCNACFWDDDLDEPSVALCPLHAAAPDLLEACKAVYAYEIGENCLTWEEGVIQLIKKAIAKAEGLI